MHVLKRILEEIENTTYPDEGIGCGLEDIGITDRYEASAYGWDKAIEMVSEIIKNYMNECKDTNIPGEYDWIPCSERMPEEYDTIFAKFKGTDKWAKGMFEKKSKEVNVTIKGEDGKIFSDHAHTCDGRWANDTLRIRTKCEVIAWMPLPTPYNLKEK